MDADSILQLQKIDCNCNDCKHMVRDEVEYRFWSGYTEHLQYMEFLRSRRVLLITAGSCIDNQNKAGLSFFTHAIKKAKFQFDKAQLTLSYGVCTGFNGKFNQPVTFIPNIYQADTQHCFEHRRGCNKQGEL